MPADAKGSGTGAKSDYLQLDGGEGIGELYGELPTVSSAPLDRWRLSELPDVPGQRLVAAPVSTGHVLQQGAQLLSAQRQGSVRNEGR